MTHKDKELADKLSGATIQRQGSRRPGCGVGNPSATPRAGSAIAVEGLGDGGMLGLDGAVAVAAGLLDVGVSGLCAGYIMM